MEPGTHVDIPVLLVDDRDQDRLALKTVLSTEPYRLVTAASGEEALKRVLDDDFAVILLDVLMPRLDGFEVAAMIKQRERSRQTPIIFLTAAGADMTFIYKGYLVGAVDYLTKPVDADVLRAKVRIFAEIFQKDLLLRRQAAALAEAERREGERRVARVENESRKRYRNLAEAIPQIVWTASPDGALTYCSRRWQEYTGLAPERALGWGWLEAVHPDEARAVEMEWREALESGRSYEAEYRLHAGEEGWRWQLCRAEPERDEKGEIIGWLGTTTDCDELKRANAATEEALRARDEFLSIASHELRTPMTALDLQAASVRLLLRDLPQGDLQGRVTGKLDAIARQVRRLERLIDNLLDVTRIMAGRLQLESEEFDLGTALRELVERHEEEARRAGCEVGLEVGPGIVGAWDRLRIEQVVTNLLSNAFKYGAGQPVTVTAEGDGVGVRIAVRDHGIGIPERDFDRLFQRFERVTSVRAYGGLGLGLYIAHQIVEAHGGRIRVESEVGAGSTFHVELPLRGPALAAPDPFSPASTPAWPSPPDSDAGPPAAGSARPVAAPSSSHAAAPAPAGASLAPVVAPSAPAPPAPALPGPAPPAPAAKTRAPRARSRPTGLV